MNELERRMRSSAVRLMKSRLRVGGTTIVGELNAGRRAPWGSGPSGTTCTGVRFG